MAAQAAAWVDFNDADEHDQVVTLRRFFAPAAMVEPGQQLIVGDDEGNTCPATITSVGADGRVALQLDRSQFAAGAGTEAIPG